MRPPQHGLGVALLTPLAWLYGAWIGARNRYYDRVTSVSRADLPVFSVGNLTAGGTGKTPIVAWIAAHLLDEGRRPAVVSRGYGGAAGAGPVVVSSGSGPQCSPRVCGDEPYLLASKLLGVPVIVGSDRIAGARKAADLGAEVVVLDDGFQHRRLARDLDILLLDASNPFGNYQLLPAGFLREPIRNLARADVVLITRSKPGERFAIIERVVRRYNPQAPLLSAGHRAMGFYDRQGQPSPRPSRCVAFCGIGNPSRFRMDLETLGTEVLHFSPTADHHRHTADELDHLKAIAAKHNAALVTTEKDLARMDRWLPRDAREPLALRIEAVIHEPGPLLQLMRGVMGRAA